MQKNIGSKLALYPMPLLVIGTMVDGKVNWLLAGHSGIKETKKLSINLVSEEMLKKADYVGSVSGSKVDKSDVFEYHIGDSGSPIINNAPVVMECSVEDNYETDAFDNFIMTIDNTYVQEENLHERGKIDYTKFSPVLFEFPKYTYLRTGDTIGNCLKLDK